MENMRLSMAVNGGNPIVASLPRPGYLSAHLNLSDRPKDDEQKKTIRLNGIETGEIETVHLKWPYTELKVGDIVELRVLPDGEGTEPCEIRKSSESSQNLFSNSQLAEDLLNAVEELEKRLSNLLEKSKDLEPSEEHQNFSRKCGSVFWELGENFLQPVYRRHRELIPEAMKGEIL